MEKKSEDGLESVKSLFEVSSVLSKNKFKPYWETVRDYFFIVMITTAVYMAFSAQPGQHFYCRPSSQLQNNLTTDDSSYVAAVCFGQYSKLEPINAFVGPLTLVLSLLEYVCVMLWLASPSVVDLFSKVRKVDKEASASDIEIKALDELIQQAMLKATVKGDHDTKSVLLVKKICEDLWALKSKSGALIQYVFRNMVSLLLLVISTLIPVHVWQHQDSLFECKIEINNYHKMICVHTIADKVAPSLIVFAASVAIQVLLQFFGLVQLLIPSLVKDDGSLVVHFAAYSRTLGSITTHIISKTLSDIQDEVEAEEESDEVQETLGSEAGGQDEPSSSESLDIEKIGQALYMRTRASKRRMPAEKKICYSLLPLENEVEKHQKEFLKQKLKILRKNVLNAMGAKDFASCIEAHKKFFSSCNIDILSKDCGCDNLSFNLQDVDLHGKSFLYYALKKTWLSGPDCKVFYHVLFMSTENYALSKDKIVDDGRVWTTAGQFLKNEYGRNNELINNLVNVLKNCENKDDFAKYVKMNADKEFIFEDSSRQLQHGESG